MRSNLKNHKLVKGKFVTPLNVVAGDTKTVMSWATDRFPEYLWIALAFTKCERREAFQAFFHLIKRLRDEHSDIRDLKISTFLSLDSEKQEQLFELLSETFGAKIFSPLLLIHKREDYPIFANCFDTGQRSIDGEIKELEHVMRIGMPNKSDLSADIRFLVIAHNIALGLFHPLGDFLDSMNDYSGHSQICESVRSFHGRLRVTEMGLQISHKVNRPYIDYFWQKARMLGDCELLGLQYPENQMNPEEYLCSLHETLTQYLHHHETISPHDRKSFVLLSITTYCYKRLHEVSEHKLFHTIAGRGVVRTIIECYIMMKYLIKHESEHDDIWNDFQHYGIGQFKLIVTRFRESRDIDSDSHVDYEYLEAIVNEYMDEILTDMDTRYFNNQNIRAKAEDVKEKELYGLYYDYDSAFEHGLWGAIRESSLLHCDSPLHKYHCVIDLDNVIKMKDIWPDCKRIMDRILELLKPLF